MGVLVLKKVVWEDPTKQETFEEWPKGREEVSQVNVRGRELGAEWTEDPESGISLAGGQRGPSRTSVKESRVLSVAFYSEMAAVGEFWTEEWHNLPCFKGIAQTAMFNTDCRGERIEAPRSVRWEAPWCRWEVLGVLTKVAAVKVGRSGWILDTVWRRSQQNLGVERENENKTKKVKDDSNY